VTRQALIGTDLDRISQSTEKIPSWRVLLFDPYQDTLSDITLNRYQQVPLDITPWVESVDVTASHDHDANQCSVNIAAGSDLDWRLLLFSWVKIYEGDYRVPYQQWPCVFSGQFQGQPGRNRGRDNMLQLGHTAIDRSIFYRDRRITSDKVWLPNDATGTDVGEIAVEIATNTVWGMGLDRSEVLFGKLGYQINKKLQVVDEPPMQALRKLMQVVQVEPSFNGEGKLIAKRVDLDKVPIRGYSDYDLVETVDTPQNNLDLLSAVVVRGLDYRVSEVKGRFQKMLTIGPNTIGFFQPEYVTDVPWGDEESQRARTFGDDSVVNLRFEGSFLTSLLAYAGVDVTVSTRDDDRTCHIEIYLRGAEEAIILLIVMFLVYLGLKLLGNALGQAIWPLGFIFDTAATLLLFAIIQMMQAIGVVNFEVWAEPYEYVYQELEAKARLTDIPREEEKKEEVENFILGKLTECESLARKILRRKLAESAQRTVTLASDQLIEPNDVIELEEDGETARYYVLEISKTMSRGDSTEYSLTCFRAK
jgi:hypothetical protein